MHVVDRGDALVRGSDWALTPGSNAVAAAAATSRATFIQMIGLRSLLLIELADDQRAQHESGRCRASYPAVLKRLPRYLRLCCVDRQRVGNRRRGGKCRSLQ
jgi:hypothetical protein